MTNKPHATILGIPLDLGAENVSVSLSPHAFRYQNIVKKLTGSGFSITDGGNIFCEERNKLSITNPKLKYLDEILRVSESSAKKVHSLIKKSEKVIILGGDHSITLGIVSGASVAFNRDLGLIYFDAHGDMNTDKTTFTGNIHGMCLASLMGYGNERLVNVYKKGKKVAKENLLHIGGNDFDQAEIELINKENIPCFRLFDILSEGLQPLWRMIDTLQSQVTNIWISLDLDSIDEIYAPGAGMPSKAGLSYREITTIAEYIGKQCNVVGVDIVEYNPLQDVDGKTAELSIELIAKLLRSNYSWYTNYMEGNKIKK